MTSLDDHFTQLSPILDDVVARIGAARLCPYKAITLATWAMTRIAIGARLEAAKSDNPVDAISAEERQHLMEMLEDNMRQSNAAMMAVLERHGAILQ